MAKKRSRLFYLHGDLHRILIINRPSDLVTCWNYTKNETVGYNWSDVRKRMDKAFTTQQVADMIGRHRVVIEGYIIKGLIRAPQRTYTLNEERKPGKYMWCERDVYDLHDYLLTVHIGRPRKDGRVTPAAMPTKAELRAMMQHDTVMYMKSKSGEFVPVWREIEWP